MTNGNEVPQDVQHGLPPSSDPFHADNYNEIEFTQLSKIYDVLMTLVQLQNPTAAARLQEAHAKGVLVGPSPVFSGEFLYDTANLTKGTADAADIG